MVQREQHRSRPFPCQFGYPLSFRRQVRRVHGPFPCFPPMALSSRRPPFLARVLASPVPRSHRYYGGATTSHPLSRGRLLVRFHNPHGLRFRVRLDAPGGAEVPFQARALVSPVALITRLVHAWTRMGSLRSSGDPSCAFAVFQDPGRTDLPLPLAVTSMLPPRSGRRRLRQWLISGLTHSFGTRCRTLHALRCRTRARLASGWPARPLPRGSRTLWVATR